MNIELNFPPKLRGARSRLYRRRFLQVNTRWKALAEIYTMHSFAPFSNLNFFVKNRQKILRLNKWKFTNSIAKNSNFAFFLRIFDEFFSGFRAKFQKIVTCVAFSIKFAKTNQKFAENSEFCEKNSLLFWIIHFTPRSRSASSSGPRSSPAWAWRACRRRRA